MDNVEKLQQLKQLLDEGILSQEEFESRKETILFPEKAAERIKKEEEERIKKEEEQKKDQLFDEAVKKFEEKNSEAFKKAFAELETLGDWRDANLVIENHKEELEEIERAEEEIKAEEERDALFERALKKFEIKTSKAFNSAIADLEKLGDWRSAPEVIEEHQEELREIEAKEEAKKKSLKKKIIIAASAVVAVIAVFAIAKAILTPNLASFIPTKEAELNMMTYKIPKECKVVDSKTDTYALYSLSMNNKVVGVIEVEYRGDSDLDGKAGCNEASADHPASNKALKIIEDGAGIYQTIKADNSIFEVTVYSNDKVKGNSELLSVLAESFDTSGYKNPRESEGIDASYTGDASAGTTIKANIEGLSVSEKFKTAIGEGTKDVTYTVDKEVTLKAGETSTVKIKANGQEYDLKVKCSDHGAFYKDGSFTASLDDIMADYKENYSSVHAYSGSTLTGGNVNIVKKDNTYGGQFECSATEHSFIVTFTGVEGTGEKEKASSEVPDDLMILIMTNGDEEKEDLICIVSLFGNMLANLNPEIAQNDAFNDVLEGMQAATGSSVASTNRNYKGISYTATYTPGLYTMKIGG